MKPKDYYRDRRIKAIYSAYAILWCGIIGAVLIVVAVICNAVTTKGGF